MKKVQQIDCNILNFCAIIMIIFGFNTYFLPINLADLTSEQQFNFAFIKFFCFCSTEKYMDCKNAKFKIIWVFNRNTYPYLLMPFV